ncbi:sulfatase-like hydrolase/transferase [Noviherbaspirillum galbum]|uniref:Sulfatase-like hydrolase/transferase n=1 Tax=Noviherbaspirillum galbum TaxID=2709383 RepID=A0A6B3SK60_9BURK|nr:sulfatase-like hydrolase/transferase [Noviherbaspirillum galbum]NEX61191.1 sulfatase-like hydrolase/transferase [Noviherbaspirillum galbum]
MVTNTQPSLFSRPRFALFCAVLAPMSVWLMTDARLARPWEVAAWGLCLAVWAICLPPRFARWCAVGQLLAMPLTLAWLGTVAVSGTGPSFASTASVSSGSFRVVIAAIQMAFGMPAFILAGMLSVSCALWAWRATRDMPAGMPKWTQPLVLAGLLLLSNTAMSVYPGMPQLATFEAKVSVPWLSHLDLLKEEAGVALTRAATGGHALEVATRYAQDAPHLFDMPAGLAVFIVGESLRADALMVPARGPWSRALARRLQQGLGVRLPDACSAGNATFVAVPRLMTASGNASPAELDKKPTVLALARAAGAKTAYINNHDVWIVPELGHDDVLKTSSMEISAYDDVAIEAMSDFLVRTPERHKAVMLHLFGEHFNYEERYPASMFPAEPAGLSKEKLLELRYARAAENSVRHLLMVAELLDRQEDPAFLVFTSDHGENLPSDHTGKRFHAGAWVGRNDTTVPALVLWNRAFARSGRAESIERLVEAKGLIAHQDVAKAWLALAGMPGIPDPSSHPTTFGASGLASQSTPDVACADLRP